MSFSLADSMLRRRSATAGSPPVAASVTAEAQPVGAEPTFPRRPSSGEVERLLEMEKVFGDIHEIWVELVGALRELKTALEPGDFDAALGALGLERRGATIALRPAPRNPAEESAVDAARGEIPVVIVDDNLLDVVPLPSSREAPTRVDGPTPAGTTEAASPTTEDDDRHEETLSLRPGAERGPPPANPRPRPMRAATSPAGIEARVDDLLKQVRGFLATRKDKPPTGEARPARRVVGRSGSDPSAGAATEDPAAH